MGRALVSAPATLGALAALLVCWSLQTGWKASFGPLFQWLGNLGLTIPIPHFPNVSIHPFSFALTIDHNVRAWLSQGIALSERAFVKFLWYTVEPFLLMAGVTLALALALYELGNYLVHVAPRITTHVIHERLIKPATKTITVIKGTTAARFNALTARVTALAAQVHHIAATLPHDIAIAPAKIGISSRQLRRLARRTHALEKKTVGLGAVALVTAALVRMGFGFFKCSGWQRVGRKLTCGMSKFFESLLGLAIDSLLITHLCETTKLLTRIGVAAQPLIVKLTTGVADLMRCQGAGPLPLLPLASFTLPEVEGDGLPL